MIAHIGCSNSNNALSTLNPFDTGIRQRDRYSSRYLAILGSTVGLLLLDAVGAGIMRIASFLSVDIVVSFTSESDGDGDDDDDDDDDDSGDGGEDGDNDKLGDGVFVGAIVGSFFKSIS